MSHTTDAIKSILEVLEVHNNIMTGLNDQVCTLEDKVERLEKKLDGVADRTFGQIMTGVCNDNKEA